MVMPFLKYNHKYVGMTNNWVWTKSCLTIYTEQAKLLKALYRNPIIIYHTNNTLNFSLGLLLSERNVKKENLPKFV